MYNKLKKRLIVLLMVVFAIGCIIQPVAAQERNTTQTPTETPTASNQVTIQVDNTVTVRSYSYNEETGVMRVVIDSEYEKQAVASDMYAGYGQDGATTVPQRSVDLNEGKTVLTMNVTEYEEYAGIGLATNQGAVRLSDQFKSEPLFEWTPGWSDLYMMILVSSFASFLGVGIAYIRVKRSDDTRVERWF